MALLRSYWVAHLTVLLDNALTELMRIAPMELLGDAPTELSGIAGGDEVVDQL